MPCNCALCQPPMNPEGLVLGYQDVADIYMDDADTPQPAPQRIWLCPRCLKAWHYADRAGPIHHTCQYADGTLVPIVPYVPQET